MSGSRHGTGRQRLRCDRRLAAGQAGALPPGRAFPIDDALIVTRWTALILPRRYRVVIALGYEDAEEVIEVYIPKARAPTFRVRCTAGSILVTDCIGLVSSFTTLPEALLAIAPLSRPSEREMLKGACPTWLPALTECAANPAGSVWSRMGGFVSEAVRKWALRG